MAHRGKSSLDLQAWKHPQTFELLPIDIGIVIYQHTVVVEDFKKRFYGYGD